MMEKQIEDLVSDREKFNKFIYISLDEALRELEDRKGNVEIEKYINSQGEEYIPEFMKKEKYAILARPIATPNYELRRFVSIAEMAGLRPLIWEYVDSKFIPQNETKYTLARLGFYLGQGKKGGMKIHYVNVLDINESCGKNMSEIETFWGQSFSDFHHDLFKLDLASQRIYADIFYDGSDWYKKNGPSAKEYYTKFLSLFLKNAILFENFMLDEKEIQFTREIFLPSFMNLLDKTGKVPLIVALEPTLVEEDRFWNCYPDSLLDEVKNKLYNVE